MSDLAATTCGGGCSNSDNGCSWIIILCYYAAAVVATAQAFSVAVDAVTMDAILSSGSFSFSAAADADSNICFPYMAYV